MLNNIASKITKVIQAVDSNPVSIKTDGDKIFLSNALSKDDTSIYKESGERINIDSIKSAITNSDMSNMVSKMNCYSDIIDTNVKLGIGDGFLKIYDNITYGSGVAYNSIREVLPYFIITRDKIVNFNYNLDDVYTVEYNVYDYRLELINSGRNNHGSHVEFLNALNLTTNNIIGPNVQYITKNSKDPNKATLHYFNNMNAICLLELDTDDGIGRDVVKYDVRDPKGMLFDKKFELDFTSSDLPVINKEYNSKNYNERLESASSEIKEAKDAKIQGDLIYSLHETKSKSNPSDVIKVWSLKNTSVAKNTINVKGDKFVVLPNNRVVTIKGNTVYLYKPDGSNKSFNINESLTCIEVIKYTQVAVGSNSGNIYFLSIDNDNIVIESQVNVGSKVSNIKSSKTEKVLCYATGSSVGVIDYAGIVLKSETFSACNYIELLSETTSGSSFVAVSNRHVSGKLITKIINVKGSVVNIETKGNDDVNRVAYNITNSETLNNNITRLIKFSENILVILLDNDMVVCYDPYNNYSYYIQNIYSNFTFFINGKTISVIDKILANETIIYLNDCTYVYSPLDAFFSKNSNELKLAVSDIDMNKHSNVLFTKDYIIHGADIGKYLANKTIINKYTKRSTTYNIGRKEILGSGSTKPYVFNKVQHLVDYENNILIVIKISDPDDNTVVGKFLINIQVIDLTTATAIINKTRTFSNRSEDGDYDYIYKYMEICHYDYMNDEIIYCLRIFNSLYITRSKFGDTNYYKCLFEQDLRYNNAEKSPSILAIPERGKEVILQYDYNTKNLIFLNKGLRNNSVIKTKPNNCFKEYFKDLSEAVNKDIISHYTYNNESDRYNNIIKNSKLLFIDSKTMRVINQYEKVINKYHYIQYYGRFLLNIKNYTDIRNSIYICKSKNSYLNIIDKEGNTNIFDNYYQNVQSSGKMNIVDVNFINSDDRYVYYISNGTLYIYNILRNKNKITGTSLKDSIRITQSNIKEMSEIHDNKIIILAGNSFTVIDANLRESRTFTINNLSVTFKSFRLNKYSNTLFAYADNSSSVYIIDYNTGTLLKTINLPDTIHTLGIVDHDTIIFSMNNNGSNKYITKYNIYETQTHNIATFDNNKGENRIVVLDESRKAALVYNTYALYYLNLTNNAVHTISEYFNINNIVGITQLDSNTISIRVNDDRCEIVELPLF